MKLTGILLIPETVHLGWLTEGPCGYRPPSIGLVHRWRWAEPDSFGPRPGHTVCARCGARGPFQIRTGDPDQRLPRTPGVCTQTLPLAWLGQAVQVSCLLGGALVASDLRAPVAYLLDVAARTYPAETEHREHVRGALRELQTVCVGLGAVILTNAAGREIEVTP